LTKGEECSATSMYILDVWQVKHRAWTGSRPGVLRTEAQSPDTYKVMARDARATVMQETSLLHAFLASVDAPGLFVDAGVEQVFRWSGNEAGLTNHYSIKPYSRFFRWHKLHALYT
jgi:hypothetical protein